MYRVESPEIVGKAKSLFLNIFPFSCIEWKYFSRHLINTELKFPTPFDRTTRNLGEGNVITWLPTLQKRGMKIRFSSISEKRMDKGKRIMPVTERIFFRYTLYTKSLQEDI